jgi:PIN domain nuclease of toxin-antitoxin system
LKLLLDTHIWIWLLQNPQSLAPNILRELSEEANDLWLSPVSVWEALILHRKGRIRLPKDLNAWLAQATAGMREATLTHEIALASQELQIHDDPADRFLAATAQVLDLTLVTADERLLGLGAIRSLANR